MASKRACASTAPRDSPNRRTVTAGHSRKSARVAGAAAATTPAAEHERASNAAKRATPSALSGALPTSPSASTRAAQVSTII
eukprot:10967052-Alexandrium_andersonii.AAC.1